MRGHINCKYDFKIKPYINISKKYHLLIFAVLGISISLYTVIKPLANEQLLNEYKAIGIESIDDRYVSESESLKINSEIINRFYKSRFLGGGYYKIEVKIEVPLEKIFVLEVDPLLYQTKKIGDSLLINVQYTKDIDKLKDTKSIIINDIFILE